MYAEACRNARGCTISTSTDGTTFTERSSISHNAANVTTHDFSASARYVKLTVTWATNISGVPNGTVAVDTQNGTVRLPELEIYGASAGAGTITSSPAGIDCGSTCEQDESNGAVVDLTATPGADSTFTGWTGACSGTGTCSVTMDAARYVNANFGVARTLATATSGTSTGTVTCDGGTCASSYADGTDVTLHATPDAGSYFDGWEGACSGFGDCTLSMDGVRSAVAALQRHPSQLRTLHTGRRCHHRNPKRRRDLLPRCRPHRQFRCRQ